MPDTHPHERGTDQIFEGITWSKVTKIAGAIIAVGTILITTITFLLSSIVTRSQMDAIVESTNAYRRITDGRLTQLENTADSTNKALVSILRLQGSMATVQCFTLERDRSSYYARAAKLPCDTLLGR